jgi:16S rRNA (guanine966-N2)-methyltransferase
VKTLGFAQVEVLAHSVAATLARTPVAPYDVVFLDPPYPLANEDVEAALDALVAHDWLTPGAMVVVERSARGEPPAWPSAIEPTKDRKYGETLLRYGHAARPVSSIEE